MKNHRWSAFGGEANESENKKPVEVKAHVHTFSHPDEHKEFLERLTLGRQFDLRFRALIHYYGDDIIAYKRKYPTSQKVNEFLRIFSNYLTDYLEDDVPSSWQECQSTFWEELIYFFYPHFMKTSIKQRESISFLSQLKKFVYWLDQRTGCSWYKEVEKYAETAREDLQTCERLLNALYLQAHPQLHDKNWNPMEDILKMNEHVQSYSHVVEGIFEVKAVEQHIIIVEEIDSGQSFQIVDFPVEKLVPGILLDGIMGKMVDDFFWSWQMTLGVYPAKAKAYSKEGSFF